MFSLLFLFPVFNIACLLGFVWPIIQWISVFFVACIAWLLTDFLCKLFLSETKTVHARPAVCASTVRCGEQHLHIVSYFL